MTTALETERQKLYRHLTAPDDPTDTVLALIGEDEISTIADKHSGRSTTIARLWTKKLGGKHLDARPKGQTSGSALEKNIEKFLSATMPMVAAIRPGNWNVTRITSDNHAILGQYEPYRHLGELASAMDTNPKLRALIGDAYAILPDVIITRAPEEDSAINGTSEPPVVDDMVARKTIIRAVNNSAPILHAVVSCKWTMRTDRAQNTRSEALSLIRGRKGRLPHVVVVTAEPLPDRLTSLALGTGDIDMVYHLALPELQETVEEIGDETSKDLLKMMIEGKRLRDISDLPLDLAV